jgi:hypothetical protein
MLAYTYHTDDLVLRVPAGFRDHTIQTLEWQVDGGRVALAVQRERLGAAETLDGVYEKATRGYPKQLFAYRLDGEDMVILHGIAARTARFRWKHQGNVLYHHQAFLVAGGTAFVLTASGPVGAAARIDELIRDTLAGLRLRGALT